MNRLIWILLLICSIVLMSCKKPIVQEDNLIPPDQFGIVFTDTFELETFTSIQDSVVASGLSYNLLGGMDDPIFGKSYASFYTQLALPNNNIDLGNVLKYDSLVLTLKFSTTYGNVSAGQSLVVKKMTEAIESEKEYFSNKTFQTDNAELGRIDNFDMAYGDSIEIDGSIKSSVIRFKLDDAFGQDLLNQSGGINLSSTEAFQSYMKGLYIGPDENNIGEAMYYVDLADPLSLMTLYYNDTSKLEFLINSQTWAVENFKHDRAGYPIEPYVNSGNKSDSLLFVQPMATTKAVIRVPDLLKLDGVIINKAELILSEVRNVLGNTYDNKFTAPFLITAVGSDSIGRAETIPDQYVSSGYFGGQVITDTINGQELSQYKISLARFYQYNIDVRNQDYGVFVLPLPSNIIANRVVFGGGKHSSFPAKLRLTYTKIE